MQETRTGTGYTGSQQFETRYGDAILAYIVYHTNVRYITLIYLRYFVLCLQIWPDQSTDSTLVVVKLGDVAAVGLSKD